MTTKVTTSLGAWTFGKYVTLSAPKAYLGIWYLTNGRATEEPLVLKLADAQNAKLVMDALLNAGADIHPERDADELKRRLKSDALCSGTFSTRLGVVGDNFLTVRSVTRNPSRDLIVGDTVLSQAREFFGRKGKLERWQKRVATPAAKSTVCAFAIMQALAAVILGRVLDAGDEGFLINLAGPSSVGKTTALMAAKSVSGPGSKLSSWDDSKRSLPEQAAALSDTLMAIDDLDKISNEPGFARKFTGITHALTSGSSRKYAAMVKDRLPDLTWNFCGMTGACTTVEELSAERGHRREPHERVRCLDIRIPRAADGGIWDRRAPGDLPESLTDRLKVATTQVYGSPLHAWLKYLADHPEAIERAKAMVAAWIADRGGASDKDGISHRVAKKFGLVHAAGMLGVEAGILPWEKEFVTEVVRDVHSNALSTLFPDEAAVRGGLSRLLAEARSKALLPKAYNVMPSFKTGRAAEFFARGDAAHIYIGMQRLKTCFATEGAAKLGLTHLKKGSVLLPGEGGKSTRQVRVKVAGVVRKVRYLALDLNRLRELVDETT
ncbi:DUF927 domain-containing protein [Paracoccus sp. S-4012]|uniref:DUF927 domain-containing protein n=1 Tax=Paracoccus sp. S-4012 TaxID=2665648 RepID=UPI0012B081A1|nr:DUF927 domain-containing protein [Paracoccus sp. S-4012]MRX49445.1 DUF927 domain-containing protein [Paracoccus sp. S-4012]